MGLYYDKNRKRWAARITIDGKRVFLGRFDTEREALAVYLRADLMREMAKYFTLENIKIDYIEDDVSITWLEPFRKMKIEKLARRLQAAYIATIVSSLKRSKKRKTIDD